MRYALLICTEEAREATMTPEEGRAQHAEYMAFQEDISANLLSGARLRPTTDATTVRVRDDEVLTSDGPFAETKEQMAGFYLVEAKDLDEAIELAAKIPGASWGSIEVRPIWEI